MIGGANHTPKQNVGPMCFFFEKNLGSGCQTWGPLFQPKSNLLKLSIFLVFNNPALGGVPQKQRERGKGIFRRPTKNDQNAALYAPNCLPVFEAYAGPSQSNQTRSNSIFSRLV